MVAWTPHYQYETGTVEEYGQGHADHNAFETAKVISYELALYVAEGQVVRERQTDTKVGNEINRRSHSLLSQSLDCARGQALIEVENHEEDDPEVVAACFPKHFLVIREDAEAVLTKR